ncbi:MULTISPECIES: hypothetical protein [Arthrobacter]|uniref:Uncharacterized protein n=1 Tax=Arthrobacter sunyaminii TaxID=2816859 RepID=A0A975S7P7_9MICC|nr:MULTISPECIES: hypothetical protein [Arthrobacter]MBO0896657.1 hypothetical protein [Arthrobacter sunyaminii]MBO0908370.1 hypothetical protein [Arthrobacter sunyaminii]MDN3483479.1 hypothetical protein [Arthrobacter sp. APC 3897]QWQ37352.1 hypothetical protein KG104_06295 [Arthrobacter sunyaminii]
MWSVILMGLAGILIGGAISFRRQGMSKIITISFWVLAGMSLLGAYLLIDSSV